jgi:hypothetical protein
MFWHKVKLNKLPMRKILAQRECRMDMIDDKPCEKLEFGLTHCLWIFWPKRSASTHGRKKWKKKKTDSILAKKWMFHYPPLSLFFFFFRIPPMILIMLDIASTYLGILVPRASSRFLSHSISQLYCRRKQQG